jgi:hypothetical protein
VVVALTDARVQHALTGEQAVALWVASIDPSGVRGTRNIDVLVRSEDVPDAIRALTSAGFRHHVAERTIVLRLGPDTRLSEDLRIAVVGEPIGTDRLVCHPDVHEVVQMSSYPVVVLHRLVEFLLAEFRTEHRVHLDDLMDAGLIDPALLGRLSEPLRSRFRSLDAYSQG